jgi:hypothetical protein
MEASATLKSLKGSEFRVRSRGLAVAVGTITSRRFGVIV